MDVYQLSPTRQVWRHRLSSTRSVDGYRLAQNPERCALRSGASVDRHPSLRRSPTPRWLSPEDSLDRNMLSPSYVPESSALKRPASFHAPGRQLRRQRVRADVCVGAVAVQQEAVRCDSLDQSGSESDLSQPRLAIPPVSSTPPRLRSSSVRTLRCQQPQRVITCRSGAAGERTNSHSDPADEEVSGGDKGATASPGEQRGHLSRSASPAADRNRKQRLSPPPGEQPSVMASQPTDSGAELRRRTLSFDASSQNEED